MKPLFLKIENFKSYSNVDNQIDFSRINLACIVGKNGFGKSSIAEAIFWALFGQFEKIQSGNRSRFSEVEYINSKKDYMQVEFDFEINKTVYKVIRRLERKDKNNKQLALFIKNNNNLIPVSESTYSKTQEKIEKILGIDFNVFLHSCYLSQKRTEDFLLSSPEQRRDMLASILNLSVYDRINESAKDKRKELKFEIEGIKNQIEEKQSELSQEDELKDRFFILEKEKSSIQFQIEELRNEYNLILNEKFLTEQDMMILDQKEKERLDLIEQKKQISKKIEMLEKTIKEIELDLADEKKVKEMVNEYVVKKDELEKMKQRSAIYTELSNELAILQKQLELKNDQKRIYLSSVNEKEKQIEKNKMDILSFQNELDSTFKQLKAVQDDLNDILKKKELYEEKRNRLIQLEKELGIVDDRIKELRENYKKIGKDTARCPLCLREIKNDEEKTHIKEEIKKNGIRLNELKQNLLKQGESVKKDIDEIQNVIKNEEILRKKEKQLSNMLERYKANIEERSKQTDQLIALINQDKFSLDQCEKEIEDLSTKITEKKEKISILNFNKEEFDRLQDMVLELEKYQERLNRINLEKTKLEANRNNIDDLKGSFERIDSQLKEIEVMIFELKRKDLKRKRLNLENRLVKVQNDLKSKEEHLNQVMKELGITEQKLKSICDSKEQLIRLQNILNECTQKQKIFDVIIDATGPDGIKNEIIANTLPVIKDEANRLLKVLTDGVFSVDFKTQRETSSGRIIETLQIEISDSRGTRNYELFSGGELFRINFAIRIALSKVLLKRSGSSIRMLILDEGFGSQDEDGKDHIIECLNQIKNQFDTILVITHIEDFMDAFDQKIIVKKDMEGSKIYVV